MQVPEELQSQLKAAMQEASIPVPDSADRWNLALEALKVCLPMAFCADALVVKSATYYLPACTNT